MLYSIVVLFAALVTITSAKNIKTKDVIVQQDNYAYGYLVKVGLPLADKIRKAEGYSAKKITRHQKIVQPSLKIIDGHRARQGDMPYQAGLLVDINDGESVCGGSLITNKRVITAAHCWWDGQSQAVAFTVVLDSVKLFKGGTRLKTRKVIMHAKWNPRNYRNDIAIAYLPKAVKFSKTMKPIALPTTDMAHGSLIGHSAIASGFGYTADGDLFSRFSSLNYVKLKIIPNKVCTRVFKNVWSSNICTTGLNYKNICEGDSGGPLAVMQNNITYLVGITSFGSKDCKDGTPGGFTRVAAFKGWIDTYI